ncbi:lactosylceramide 4-alpha-galactosyltransferase-like isoform X2 [Palaemon carinicauda]|uniref:lactosylceramide 4-alpha-galactosyltransferase-like isoform X2 n=1 Tax=Palaemon carinicauda TaxID=392227 RepID=UPI0035B68079
MDLSRLRWYMLCCRCGSCCGRDCLYLRSCDPFRCLMFSRTLAGFFVAAVVLMLLVIKIFAGFDENSGTITEIDGRIMISRTFDFERTRTHPNLPAVVADYEDHFAIDVVMGVEGGVGEAGWRAAACPTQAEAPPAFPVRLPKFNASSDAKNIFFLETSCASALNAKMACAVESAAVHHPDYQVHLALTSTHVGGTDAIIQALATHQNIRIATLDVDDAIQGTGKLNRWLREMEWARGTDWAGINLSDALRLGVVCSVGGTYLDLDMWIVAPLPASDTWIGREKWDQLSNGAFRMPKDHWLCKEATTELTEHFKKNVWGHNGPGVFQRVVKNICNIHNISDYRQCKDLDMLEPSTFYPLHWKRWEDLFMAGGSNAWSWPQNTVGIHLWNKFSRGAPLHPGDGSIVDRTSKKNCPKVYSAVRQIRKLRDHLQRKKTRHLSTKHSHET